jgi:glutathione-regulated potassium-efflux system ancillary protein KefC
LSHGVITQAQYSAVIAAVVASAVVPTLIANAFFLPRHLLKAGADSEPRQLASTPRTSNEF